MITDTKIQIIKADLSNMVHAENFLKLTAAYMADPMGETFAWNEDQKTAVIKEMKEHPSALVLFALVDNEYVGICTCFYAYSTFLAKPLLNIHDIYVSEAHRGIGVGKKLIQSIEEIAQLKGCGKIPADRIAQNLQGNLLPKSR